MSQKCRSMLTYIRKEPFTYKILLNYFQRVEDNSLQVATNTELCYKRMI